MTRKRRSSVSSGSSDPAVASPIKAHANGTDDGKPGVVLLKNDNQRWANLVRRAVWTVVLVGGFVALVAAGHVYLMAMVFAIQASAFFEIVRIAHEPGKDRKVPYIWGLNWYVFFVANYFLYGEHLLRFFEDETYLDAFALLLAQHHLFICYTLYIIGIVGFVLSLKKGQYKYQFGQLAWSHMAILFVVVQPNFIINNIMEGIAWFLLPVSLVICNDIMAYIWGFSFGRTPLIALSPKKTWEGFIGGFISTVTFSFAIGWLLMQVPYLTCPPTQLSWRPFSQLNATCATDPVFEPILFQLRPPVISLLAKFGIAATAVPVAPFQFHALAMAVFASLIAPFGGFFASGFKRAFKIKDFGDVIPGHGGITDRFDCQFIMGFFAFLYYATFIKHTPVTAIPAVMHSIVNMPPEQQLELYARFTQYLTSQALLPAAHNAAQ